MSTSIHDDIKGVMDAIGRGSRDGAVRDSHLSQILGYLHQKKTEKLKSTYSKLALICGISKRVLRENYIEGLMEFGIINVRIESHDEVWNWVGLKALNDGDENDGKESL